MKNMKQNYQREMERIITELAQTFSAPHLPKLLLHSCCAPCSSSVIKRLAPHFNLTVFYYNPNINTQKEYAVRAEEQQRLIDSYNKSQAFPLPVTYIIKDYIHDEFTEIARGLEDCPEGGERCFRCYHLRIKAAAHEAQQQGNQFFCTTLSLSPLKNAAKINEIGESCASETCRWLPSDFKKKNGYLDSIRLSKEFGLYRQDYCGCEYSLR